MVSGVYIRTAYHRDICRRGRLGKSSWNAGKKMTEEFCNKIKDGMIKSGAAQKLSVALSGENNPMKRTDVKEKVGLLLKEKWKDEDYRRRQTESHSINTKETWKNPETRKKRIESNRKNYIGEKGIARREQDSLSGKKKWNSYEDSKKNRIIDALTSEESVKKRKETYKQTVNNPEWKETKGKETTKKISAKLQGIPIEEWTHFTSFEPYDEKFNKIFKKNIKERDGCCLLCNISLHDLKLLKRQIDIHHINYNKKLSVEQNCCTLCDLCHSKTVTNRKYWIKFFQSLLAERYNYKYSEDNNIILEIQNEIE
jgi:hypothetical protein